MGPSPDVMTGMTGHGPDGTTSASAGDVSAVPRTVLVTGGISGIGRAVVHAFARLGDHVVVLDAAEAASDLPSGVVAVRGDVCSAEDNERATAIAVDRFGRLDVLVANAGVHDGGLGLDEIDAAEIGDLFRKVFDVDVVGYVQAAKAAVEPLRATRGCMVFTLSDACFVVRGNGAGLAYTAAKHAVAGIVWHLAADLAPEVRVNGVAPGGVLTRLRAVTPRGERDVFDDPSRIVEQIRRLNPLQVVLTPDQIALVYTFLASAAAQGMTGEILRPDGGLGVR